MLKRKKTREKGKIRLSEYFKELKGGDVVAIKRDLSLPEGRGFPRRIQGKTGVVNGKRGRCYIIKMKDYNMEKSYIVHPVHLKKLKSLNKEE